MVKNNMKKHRIYGFLSIFTMILVSCGFKGENKETVWSKWHDNGDGTHSRHDLNDITIIQTEPHTFSLKQVLVEATDVTPGKEVYKCDLCGATENRDVAPTGHYVFNQEVVDDKYLYERCSEHSAIYYKSSIEGAYGNPDYLFEHSDIDEDYTEVEYIESDGTQYVDTGVANISDYVVSYNNEMKMQYIPTSYQQVEYLKSDGKSFIDTGFYPNEKTAIEVDGDRNETVYSLYGTGHAYNLTGSGSTQYYYYWKHNSACYTPEGTRRAIYKQDGPACYLNGEQIYKFPDATFQETDSIYLFGRNSNGQLNDSGEVIIYYAKIWDNGVLSRHFIPCYEKATYDFGMYDLVTQTFFKNKGGGSFTKGEEVYQSQELRVPIGYTELEYIEATGSQCIDLGYTFESGAKYPIICEFECSVDECEHVNNPIGGCGNESWVEPVMLNFANNQLEFGTGEYFPSGSFVPKQKYSYKFYSEDGYQYWNQNGVLVATRNHEAVYNDTHFYLFRMNKSFFKGKLYSFKLTSNNRIVRDLFPVRRSEDDAIGLYDRINDVFYENIGTGTFGAGPSVSFASSTRLPLGFVELDYIEFSGTQYLNTGVIPSENLSTEIEITPNEGYMEEMAIFGADWTFNGYFLMIFDNNLRFQSRNYKVDVPTFTKNGKNTLKTYSRSLREQIFNVNGVDYTGDFEQSEVPDSTNEITIGKVTDHPHIDEPHFKLHSFKMYEGTNNIRNFVPCYREEDNEVGLFDIAENEFYENIGTGEFGKGPIKGTLNNRLPSSYQEVEYIESDGHQRINSGIYLNTSDVVDSSGTYYFLEGKSMAYMGANCYTQTSAPLECPAQTKVKLDIHYENFVSTFVANGQTQKVWNWQNTIPNNTMVGVFALGNPNGEWWVGENPKVKLYDHSLVVNGQKVRDFVPCFRKSDDEIGLYDLVSGQFFINEGEGTFTKGENINSGIFYEDFSDIERHSLPESYHQLAYVKSYGSVQISTGIKGKAKLELKGTFSKVNKNQVMGYFVEPLLCFGVGQDNKYIGTEITCGNKDEITYDYGYSDENKVSFSVNGNELVNSALTVSPDSSDIKLFAINETNRCYFKFYEAKIYQNGSLVRHFIPAKDIYQKISGLYDLVEGKFYESETNASLEGGSDLDLPANTSNINMFISRFSNEKITKAEQIKNCKIYNSNNELFREYVPVIRNNDGKPGFFEIKQKKFYIANFGNEFTYGEKLGHHFNEGVVESSPTHNSNGSICYTCSICGRKVHEKVDRLSYKVDFVVPSFVRTIRIFSEVDPTKYDESLVGYTRNQFTFNYSKSDAMIYFEVMLTEDCEYVVIASNGKVEHIEGNRYKVTGIMSDCVITINKK